MFAIAAIFCTQQSLLGWLVCWFVDRGVCWTTPARFRNRQATINRVVGGKSRQEAGVVCSGVLYRVCSSACVRL